MRTLQQSSKRPYYVEHGHTGTPEYRAWKRMKERCYRPKRMGYADYGGRGICVCDEWLHDFPAFLAHVGLRPTPKHSLDRYPDNNDGYKPGNVRWATRLEQNRNRRFKITDDQVRAIRSDPRLHRVIAEEYGLTRSFVGALKRGIKRGPVT